MAAVSMLVFIEECIYIYRKVPANKKSVIIWVNGAAPVRMASEKLWRVRRKMKICYLHFRPHPGQNAQVLVRCTVPSHSLLLLCFSGDWHHVVFGDVDPQSHHVY